MRSMARAAPARRRRCASRAGVRRERVAHAAAVGHRQRGGGTTVDLADEDRATQLAQRDSLGLGGGADLVCVGGDMGEGTLARPSLPWGRPPTCGRRTEPPWSAPDDHHGRRERAASQGRPGHHAGAVLRPGLRLHHHPADDGARARTRRPRPRAGGDHARRHLVDVRRLRLADELVAPDRTSRRLLLLLAWARSSSWPCRSRARSATAAWRSASRYAA